VLIALQRQKDRILRKEKKMRGKRRKRKKLRKPSGRIRDEILRGVWPKEDCDRGTNEKKRRTRTEGAVSGQSSR